MDDDAALLRRFANEGAQDAFAELARRKVNLVYAAALRQLGGDAHLAADVSQAVFLTLASQAAALRQHANLSGWLYTTTRFLALKAIRTQARWQRREQEAHRMKSVLPTHEPAWEELRPVIDETMHDLSPPDRTALLLRFFEGKSFASVGAELGLAENAARMRVERALEKLRTRLARRGITSTAAALTATLAAQPAVVTPAGLLAGLTAGSFAGATIAGGGAWASALSAAVHFMGTTKIIVGTAGLLAAIGAGAFLGAHVWSEPPPRAVASSIVTGPTPQAFENLRQENLRLKAELARRSSDRATAANGATIKQGGTPTQGALDNLRVVTELQRRKLITPYMPFIQRNGRGTLAPTFVELFALTPAETEALQQVVDRSRERLSQLTIEHATVERGPGGEVSITVNAFPQQGGTVYDDLISEFSAVLGPERQAAFRVLGEKHVEKALNWFGTAQQKYTFAQQPATTGDSAFTVRVDHKLPTESGNSSSEFKSLEELAAWVGPITNLLPKDFGRPK